MDEDTRRNDVPDAALVEAASEAYIERWICSHGPIPAVRVSSAQAHGAAKQYSYWGAVRYEIALRADGRVTARPMGRAGSDRRSPRLARSDAEDMAARIGAVIIGSIGALCADDLDAVYAWIVDRNARERRQMAARAAYVPPQLLALCS
jgi:hypothetical protein